MSDVIETGDYDTDSIKWGEVQALAGQMAIDWIMKSIELGMAKKVDAVSTAPIHKGAIKLVGIKEPGHTEIYQNQTHSPYALTMFSCHKLRVFFVSRHMSLVDACHYATKDVILENVINIDKELRKVGIENPLIAVAGLNPHNGDNGLFGTEELTDIGPAVEAAKAKGITVSCDLNYRNKLWSKEKAGQVMGELCKYVDVCISNEEDANDVFGIKSEGTEVTAGELNKEGYKEVAQKLTDRFGFKKVAITLRTSISANDNRWAMLYEDGQSYFSKEYLMHIVDRVGGGDSFGGGLIYACLNDYAPQDTIEFAVAASCLKHSVEGDFNMVSVDEVKKLAGGDASGRVQR